MRTLQKMNAFKAIASYKKVQRGGGSLDFARCINIIYIYIIYIYIYWDTFWVLKWVLGGVDTH